MDSIFTLKDLVAGLIQGTWSGQISTDQENGDRLHPCLEAMVQNCAAIRHQSRVVVRVSNSLETVAALLAVWYHGGVVVPVKSDVAPSALQGIADDCVADYVLNPATGELRLQRPDSAQLMPSPFRYLTAPGLTGVDLALIIYTSGSTGKPKGIMLTHANVISSIRSILAYLKIGRSDTVLLISPLSFDYGLYQLLFCLATECRLVMCSRGINPLSLLKLVEERQVTVLPLIPALATALHKYLDKFGIEVRGVRLITSTGGVLPVPTALGLDRRFPDAQVVKMYGLTESKRVSYLPAEQLAQSPDSVGIPMPGLDAKVFHEVREHDDTTYLQEVPRGVVGTLFVRGVSVFQRYFNPENDAGARLHNGLYRDDNWLATGDLFIQDEEGLLHFKGRSKDLIKQRGFCLYPRDLEAIVYRHPLVELCTVVGITDDEGNEVAKLFVSLTEKGRDTECVLKAWLKQEVDPDYMFGQIQFLDSLPLSANGKVDLAQLVRSVRRTDDEVKT